jgi:hypothetical protein
MDDQALRDEVAAACREHDRLVQREGFAGLRHRTQESAAPAKPTYVELYHDVDDPEHKYLVHDVDAHNEFNRKNWDAWVEAHLANERSEVIDIVTKTVGEVVSHERGVRDRKLEERDRAIAELRAENVELKGLVSSALATLDAVRKSTVALQQERQAEQRERQVRDDTIRERSVRIADLQRENSASHAELARKQRDQELAQRDARIELLETRVKMLCQFLSVSGYDLPRGA